ncbi:DNA repair helicase [Cytidiella melzeri]|nr:DNA repair helicase [Cytidiella melzeri]
MVDLALPTPESFPAFPFLPYEIQLELMRHLYEKIEGRHVTIVESPTGTGKTLSLLCASLTWLRDEQDRVRRSRTTADNGNPETDWVLAQTLERKRRELEAEERDYAERLAQARRKEAAIRQAARARIRKKLRPITDSTRPATELSFDEDQFLPDDVEGTGSADNNLSSEVRVLMARLDKTRKPAFADSADTGREPSCTKIYYTSRTHSQLSQVLHELEKLKINLSPASIVAVHAQGTTSQPSCSETDVTAKRRISLVDDEEVDDLTMDVRVVSLGSRKQLCINEKLKSRPGDLDESCRLLLSEKGDRRCPHLPPMDDEVRMLDFKDQILATPKDIESLVVAGIESHTCPYFGSRKAISQAQLVLLPYNLLLQKTAREALGIDLTNQVVIIDEAHNLISTLLSLSTTTMTFRILSTSLNQLNVYLTQFKNRLTTQHSLHLKRLVGLLETLVKYAEHWKAERTMTTSESSSKLPTAEVITSGELLRRLGRKVEGINLLEVEQYLRSSKIARKISGYCIKTMEQAAGEDSKKLAKLSRLSVITPPLHVVENFIVALTTANDDGRLTFSLVDNQVELKYQHLNPETHFQEVVQAARAVVLAGGTMSPISDVTNQLFMSTPSERLFTFSCGHIIPPSNLQTLVLKKGPRGSDLEFKYDKRNDSGQISELGQALLNFANVIPGGMVVFVPSYSFLHLVVEHWQGSGLFDKLKAKKKVFMEPQENSEVDAVLRDYAAEVKAGRKGGSLLFAVVGAKLSEGLNFTDELARAVIIVGLPFANLGSAELRERMNYVNRLEQKRGKGTKEPGTKDAGTELYENMCMNAVNQSIGRAIRHRGDWAALILVDARYASARIRGKLPKWIGKDMTVAETFGEAVKGLGRFYREKRS